MSGLPKRFTDFVKAYPDVGKAYNELGHAVGAAGPLDAKTRQLVKVGIVIAAGLEGGPIATCAKPSRPGQALMKSATRPSNA